MPAYKLEAIFYNHAWFLFLQCDCCCCNTELLNQRKLKFIEGRYDKPLTDEKEVGAGGSHIIQIL